MKPLTYYISAYVPIILWSGLIFFLSSQPTLPGPELFAWDFLFKKSAHMFVYFVLFFLFFRAMRMHNISFLNASMIAIMLTFTYAITDEFHQTFVPGRSGTIRDLGFDSLGMFTGWLKIHNYI